MRENVYVHALIVLLPLLALAAAGGCGGQAPEPAPEMPINVVVTTVEPVTLPSVILLPAVVAPVKSVTVPVEAAGVVEWLGVEEGARVQEGDVIARVDMRTLRAQLESARASYSAALDEFTRNEQLLAQRILSESEFLQSKARMDVAKAQLDLAQVAFEKGTISAPMSGTLNRRPVEVGEYVTSGDAIAEIVDIDRVKIVIDVPEKDVTFVKVGAPMGIIVNGGNADAILPKSGLSGGFEAAMNEAIARGDLVIGTVTYRSVTGDPATRTYRVEVRIDNPGRALLPGMIVRAVLLRRMIPNALTVPLSAVVPQEARAVVYLVAGERAVEREVSLGVTDGRNIEVTAGLSAGDTLVIEGQRQLKDGTLVRVVEPLTTNGHNASAPAAPAAAEGAL